MQAQLLVVWMVSYFGGSVTYGMWAYTLEEIVSKSTLLATRPSRLAPEKCINKSIWLATGGHLPWVHHGYLPGANQIDLFMHFLGYDHRRGVLIWTRFLLVCCGSV